MTRPFFTQGTEEKTLFIASAIFFCTFAVVTLALVIVFGMPDVSSNIGYGFTYEEDFLSIFKINMLIWIGIITGIATFGLSTIVLLSLNGSYIGLIGGYALHSGLTPLEILLLLLPHGIIEFPAFWLAGAIGLKMPYSIIKYLTGSRKFLLTYPDLKRSAVMALTSIAMITVAAWIEARFTFQLLDFV